ncbi:MAG: hypothetical protein ACRDIY_01745, partial [Chloroflexota bacterium]
MRILLITPYVPSPIRVRPYHFVRQLARSHEVVVLTLWQSQREYRDLIALREICPAVGVRLSRTRALANCLGALPGRVPLQGAFGRSPRLAALIEAALAGTADGADSLPPELRGT